MGSKLILGRRLDRGAVGIVANNTSSTRPAMCRGATDLFHGGLLSQTRRSVVVPVSVNWEERVVGAVIGAVIRKIVIFLGGGVPGDFILEGK